MVIWGLEYCRLLALGLGWLEALQWRPPTLPTQFSRSAFGFGNLVPFESSLRWGALFWICGPRLLNVATGGVWDLFVLLPRILGCWVFFARAFLLGRLVILAVRQKDTKSYRPPLIEKGMFGSLLNFYFLPTAPSRRASG